MCLLRFVLAGMDDIQSSAWKGPVSLIDWLIDGVFYLTSEYVYDI